MAEYIKKNDAYTAAGFMAAASADRELTCGEIKQIIDNIPVADVVERQRGKWEYKPSLYPYGVEHFECSLCGESVVDRTNFCPNCGADMRGET